MKKLLLLGVYVMSLNLSAQTRTSPATQNIELGKVSWIRNYDQAIKLSSDTGKPVLILFQEVPGCSTCRNYGQNVLSHPLLVEAIENEFIPLAIYNNKEGHDSQILKWFKEPSWNNPVVRIINSKGTNLVSRVSGNYSLQGLYSAMQQALIQTNRPIPEYMSLLREEITSLQGGRVKEKYFKMYCFWSGEGHLGSAKGVLSTEPGFMNGFEVVKVKYDADLISDTQLEKYAKAGNCSPIKKGANYRTDADPQYYLKHTDYKYLPLTPLQKTKINSALGKRVSPKKFLSPKQLKWLKTIEAGKKPAEALYVKDFAQAWAIMDMST